MYGVIDFFKACKKDGLKPIIGMEAYVAPRAMTGRVKGFVQPQNWYVDLTGVSMKP